MQRKTYRKVITDEQTKQLINPKNKKLVDRFLKNFNTKRADSSVVVYRQNFNIFFCWNVKYNENKFFVDIRKQEFMDFFDFCVEELKWQPNRYAQMWSSLNSLSTFIENILDDEFEYYRNQVKKIEKLPRANVRKKTILTQTQVENLLHYLQEEIDKPQEACALALACYSGCRVSEIFRFTTNIIDENNTAYDDLFIETKEEIKTKGRGKQGKMLYKYILKKPFMPYYKKWLERRKEIMEESGQEHNFLFIRGDGTPLSQQAMSSWTNRWEDYLQNADPSNKDGQYVHIYPHCFRHYLCTYLARVGLEQELIVELFGWSSADMYSIYCDLTSKDRKWKGLGKLKDAIQE